MNAGFVTTSWSLIAHTRERGDVARQATETLCRQYWKPLYAYARRSGLTPDEAEDAVQEFLLHVVEQEVFSRADAERGRFRTFLLSAMRQSMARRHRDQSRQKRAPGSSLLRLDVESAEQSVAHAGNVTPDHAFDRAWALTQLEHTWERVEGEFASAGKSALFHRLRLVVAGQLNTPVKEIASELSMSEGAVSVAAHRLRRRFAESLREQIALTLVSPGDLEDEIRHLRAMLSGRSILP